MNNNNRFRENYYNDNYIAEDEQNNGNNGQNYTNNRNNGFYRGQDLSVATQEYPENNIYNNPREYYEAPKPKKKKEPFLKYF